MSVLNDIIKGEGKKTEFKQQLPGSSSLSKTIVAFSNGAGGNILIGVKDNGIIIGISNDEVMEMPDKISNIVYDACYPSIIPEIYSENIDGKNVLVVEVFPGNLKPYYLKKEGKIHGTYIRVGAANKLADQEMIMELERQKMNISFDEECVYEINESKVKFDKLCMDFEKYTGKRLEEKDLINLKILKTEHGKNYPTKAGMLLLGNGYFEFARIKCARFKGNDVGEFIDQKEFSGPIYEQVENAMNFAKMYIARKGIITELQRKDEYDIPLIAIKEAVTNAIVHRDYNISGSDIKFAIFDNRVEITSPGQLPKTLDVYEIKTGRSEIRNKVIARVFKELRFIEEWGTGIKRIIQTCKEAGLKEPDFIETGMHFKVIIYNKSGEMVAESSGIVAESSVLNYLALHSLSINEKSIFELLQKNGTISTKEVIKATGLSESGTRKIFNSLQSKGLIKAIGEGRNRRYHFIASRK